MADMRNRGPAGPATEDDPFAELIRMVEDPNSFARGRLDQPYAPPRQEPVARVSAPAVEPVSGPESFELDETLFGLSDPSTPRDQIPNETQAFAPDRREAYHEAAPRPVVLDDFDELIAGEMAAFEPVRSAHPQHAHYEDDDTFEPLDGVDLHGDDHSAYETAPAVRARAGGSLRRRSMFFAGGVAALVLVGMFGGYTLFASPGGEGGEGGPILIKADAEPYKIAPVDPGGREVPNQNKAVYERVARVGPQPGPAQEMLITAAEEPIDLSFEEDSNLPGVMVGVSDVPAEASFEVAGLASTNEVEPVLQPRRVQTFDVRADGTLVPRGPETVASPQAPAAAPVAPPAEVASAAAEPTSVDELVASIAPAPVASPSAEPAAAEPVATAAPVAPAATTEPAPPAAAPPVEVAALTETAPAAPAGSYFVQIASQPSQALAEESRTNLAARFASAIGGRSLMIQSAEIPEKGTYYRVRVVAASKQEADSVCQSLQSAGGSCFVTR